MEALVPPLIQTRMSQEGSWKLEVSCVHFLLINVGAHLGLMFSHCFVLTSSFLDDYYFKVLLLLFRDQEHKDSMVNVSDVKDKAKYITGNTVPG